MVHNCSDSAPLCRDYTQINEEAKSLSASLPFYFLGGACVCTVTSVHIQRDLVSKQISEL